LIAGPGVDVREFADFLEPLSVGKIKQWSKGWTRLTSAAANIVLPPRLVGCRSFFVASAMKDFANASFPPEVISVMEQAFDAAVASLPEPVHSTHVQFLAEAILRGADKGERDPQILQRLALLELQLVRR
jgi:hypothetical protein